MEKVEIESGETRTVEFKKELPQNSSKGKKSLLHLQMELDLIYVIMLRMVFYHQMN